MREYLLQFMGEDAAMGVQFMVALLAVLLLFGVFVWFLRLITGKGRRKVPVGNHRLAVLDRTQIDDTRSLLLIRRDDAEHLVMIGGPSDVVVEANINMYDDEADRLSGHSVPGHEIARRVIAQRPLRTMSLSGSAATVAESIGLSAASRPEVSLAPPPPDTESTSDREDPSPEQDETRQTIEPEPQIAKEMPAVVIPPAPPEPPQQPEPPRTVAAAAAQPAPPQPVAQQPAASQPVAPQTYSPPPPPPPAPEPEPIITPVVADVAEVQTAAAPAPQPAPEPEIAPTPEPVAEPVPAPQIQAMAAPEPEAAQQPAPQPVQQQLPEPTLAPQQAQVQQHVQATPVEKPVAVKSAPAEQPAAVQPSPQQPQPAASPQSDTRDLSAEMENALMLELDQPPASLSRVNHVVRQEAPQSANTTSGQASPQPAPPPQGEATAQLREAARQQDVDLSAGLAEAMGLEPETDTQPQYSSEPQNSPEPNYSSEQRAQDDTALEDAIAGMLIGDQPQNGASDRAESSVYSAAESVPEGPERPIDTTRPGRVDDEMSRLLQELAIPSRA